MPADGEPRWTTEDRAVVAVWQDEESQLHPPCGTYRWEWKENPEAYVAEIEDCPGCAKATAKQKQMVSEHEPEIIEGWYVVLVPERFASGD